MNEAYNLDCMEGMKQFPDKYFDLAVVDPPYGGVTQGGYARNQVSGGVGRWRNNYHLALWNQGKPQKGYFSELFRVSKNQVIWGGVIISKRSLTMIRNVGLYGTKKKPRGWIMPTAS